MILKINFKPLTILAEIPILYAWPDSKLAFDAYIKNI